MVYYVIITVALTVKLDFVFYESTVQSDRSGFDRLDSVRSSLIWPRVGNKNIVVFFSFFVH